MNKKYFRPLVFIVCFGILLFVLLKIPTVTCRKYISSSIGQLQAVGVSTECVLKVSKTRVYNSHRFWTTSDTEEPFDVSLFDIWNMSHVTKY